MKYIIFTVLALLLSQPGVAGGVIVSRPTYSCNPAQEDCDYVYALCVEQMEFEPRQNETVHCHCPLGYSVTGSAAWNTHRRYISSDSSRFIHLPDPSAKDYGSGYFANYTDYEVYDVQMKVHVTCMPVGK